MIFINLNVFKKTEIYLVNVNEIEDITYDGITSSITYKSGNTLDDISETPAQIQAMIREEARALNKKD